MQKMLYLFTLKARLQVPVLKFDFCQIKLMLNLR